LVEIGTVVSEEKKKKNHPPFFLICIIGLPCNFEVNPITHFDRLCKLEKRGDEIKKKSSPLKPLGKLKPHMV
jgi:hypothetical protein